MCYSQQYETDINQCTTLKKLFDLWEEIQKKEPPKSCKKTVHRGLNGQFADSLDSFCRDGYIGEKEEYEFAKTKILFLLKESNQSNNLTGTFGKSSYQFWFKKVVQGKNNIKTYVDDAKGKRAATKYYNLLTDLGRKITGDENYNLLNAAYMNINKRGGYSRCPKATLGNYAETYKYFIQKQIKILNPTHIVCCGSDTFDILHKLYNCDSEESSNNCKHFIYCAKNKSKKFSSFMLKLMPKGQSHDVLVLGFYHPAASCSYGMDGDGNSIIQYDL